MTENFLRAKDYTYEPFQPRGFDGDSGALLLATSKTDKGSQYVIKSGMYGLACNDFMYHKIAAALGLSTPEVKLIRDLPGQKHAAAIRYIPNAKKFEHISGGEANRRDLYSFLTLYVILNEEDSEEFYVDGHGNLYKLDNAASFNITYANISLFTGGKKTGLEWLSQPNAHFIEYDKYGIVLGIITRDYGEEAKQTSLSMFARFAALDKSLFDEAHEVLDRVYLKALSGYYREFIRIRKQECASFCGKETDNSAYSSHKENLRPCRTQIFQ